MVYVHLAEGFEEIEALTVVDFLRRANIEVKTVSIEGREVSGAHNIKVISDLLFNEADYDSCKMIMLPGGMPGTLNLQNHKGLSSKIDEFYKNDKYIAAICAAPMILGAKGYLKDKDATIYPGMEDELIGANAIADSKAVIDGKIITGKGPGCAAEFALTLIAVLKGEDTMLQIKKDIVL